MSADALVPWGRCGLRSLNSAQTRPRALKNVDCSSPSLSLITDLAHYEERNSE
uniref:Uncharacterized protein n=1 Tax=Anguilla anguilla TaxID=7936 RepID=A0A0E9PHE2_ANGAN